MTMTWFKLKERRREIISVGFMIGRIYVTVILKIFFCKSFCKDNIEINNHSLKVYF